MWKELVQDFPEVFDNYVEQILWNTSREKESDDEVSSDPSGRKDKKDEKIAQNRLWNEKPGGIAFKMPTKTKSDVIYLMEFKRMTDVTNRYVVRAKCVVEEQYASFRSISAERYNDRVG